MQLLSAEVRKVLFFWIEQLSAVCALMDRAGWKKGRIYIVF